MAKAAVNSGGSRMKRSPATRARILTLGSSRQHVIVTSLLTFRAHGLHREPDQGMKPIHCNCHLQSAWASASKPDVGQFVMQDGVAPVRPFGVVGDKIILGRKARRSAELRSPGFPATPQNAGCQEMCYLLYL